jgi:hypothetical protein
MRSRDGAAPAPPAWQNFSCINCHVAVASVGDMDFVQKLLETASTKRLQLQLFWY